MPKSLKEKNQTQLITFVLANAIGLGVLLQGFRQVLMLLDSMTKGNIAVIFRLVAIPAGLALLIGILGWPCQGAGRKLSFSGALTGIACHRAALSA